MTIDDLGGCATCQSPNRKGIEGRKMRRKGESGKMESGGNKIEAGHRLESPLVDHL
jgi:hypothetical protein